MQHHRTIQSRRSGLSRCPATHSARIRPAGSKLRDTAIAAELGVSRTPVREALTPARPGRPAVGRAGSGFRLTPLDPAELREIGSILAALEPLALDQSARARTRQRLDAPDGRRAAPGADPRRHRRAASSWTSEFHRVLLGRTAPTAGCSACADTLRRSLRRYLHHYLERGGRVSLSTPAALPDRRRAPEG